MKKRASIKTSSDYWKLKDLAKENRLNPTFAEKIMWEMLRNNYLTHKFRRQHIIAHYIVDFVCLDSKLIIELDGDSHFGKEDYDYERQAFLEGLGYYVLRFTNDELFENGNIVEKKIKVILNELSL